MQPLWQAYWTVIRQGNSYRITQHLHPCGCTHDWPKMGESVAKTLNCQFRWHTSRGHVWELGEVGILGAHNRRQMEEGSGGAQAGLESFQKLKDGDD